MRVSWLVLLFVSVPVVVLAEGQARDEAATKEGLVDRMSKKPSEARDAVRQDRPDAAGEKIRHELRETVRDQREEPSEKGDDVTEEQREVVAREKEASEASPSVPADNGLIVTVAAADAGLFAATLTISLADSRLLGDCNVRWMGIAACEPRSSHFLCSPCTCNVTLWLCSLLTSHTGCSSAIL